jgi:hypothetical protein
VDLAESLFGPEYLVQEHHAVTKVRLNRWSTSFCSSDHSRIITQHYMRRSQREILSQPYKLLTLKSLSYMVVTESNIIKVAIESPIQLVWKTTVNLMVLNFTLAC